jgi:hypothetical protein
MPHRRTRYRALARSLGAALLLAAAPLAAQPATPPTIDFTRDWRWSDLEAVRDVNATELAWLRANVPDADARSLFATLARLSRPEAIQLLPSYFFLDGSATYFRRHADSLFRRPPAGVPGMVRAAYLTSWVRKQILDSYRGVFRFDFTGAPLALPPRPRPRASRQVRVDLAFDFAPAETLLAIIGTPDVSEAEVARRIATPAFDALIQHRSQGFYPVPLTRERLAANLAAAASTRPLDRLYRYTQPLGLLHFAEVSERRAQYRALLATLRANERAILAVVADTIALYLPAGTAVTRTASFYFADGADGWGANGVAGVDLEYYKDDFPGFLNVVIHETFHSAQTAVRTARPPRPPRAFSPGDSAMFRALEQLLVEGTANFVAPATVRTAASADSVARAGAAIVEQLHAATLVRFERDRARELTQQGVAGGGPFYWLGAAMSRAIATHLGADALANTLTGDGVAFFETYLRAVEAARGRAPQYFTPQLVEAVRRMPR